MLPLLVLFLLRVVRAPLDWKMTQTLGGLMFALYFLFLVQAILTEYFTNPCFGHGDLGERRRRSLAALR